MRRDWELIRTILLQVEGNSTSMHDWIDPIESDGHGVEVVSHHVWLLYNGGYLEAIDLSTMDGMDWRPKCLTWAGEEFLADIRERDIWERTLEIARKGGTASLAALADIAKTLATKKLQKFLELDE